MNAWITQRGKSAGPLLFTFSQRHNDERRLTTWGAYRVIRDLGSAMGIYLHPHMLCHSAITPAVEQSVALGLSLDEVMDFPDSGTFTPCWYIGTVRPAGKAHWRASRRGH